jgi:hypothetical protein
MNIILQKQVEECPGPQEPVIDFLYIKGMKTCTPRPTDIDAAEGGKQVEIYFPLKMAGFQGQTVGGIVNT